MKSLSFSADRKDHLMLFRSYVSSKAAGKANAVLEGVGLNAPTIKACSTAYPLNDEEIVQAGLIRWCESQGPTWGVLIAAMKYAKIDQQDIEGLKTSLIQPAVTEGLLSLPCGVLLAVTVTVWEHCGAFLGLHVPYSIYLHGRSDLCTVLHLCPFCLFLLQHLLPLSHHSLPLSHLSLPLSHHSIPLSHHSLPLSHHSLPLSHHSLPLSHHSIPLSHHSVPVIKVS